MALVNFSNLDFDQVKQSLKDYLKSNSDFTDYDFEGSNLSTILDVLAYNTYTSSYNANMVANEVFIDSATLRENVVSLARNIGYVPRSRKAARVNVSFTVNTSNITPTPGSITLKKGAVVASTGSRNAQSFIFSILDDITVPVYNQVATFTNIPVFQGSVLTSNYTYSARNVNQRFELPNAGIDTDLLYVSVKANEQSTAKVKYSLQDSLFEVGSASNVYYIQEIEDERYEIFFGDGVFGRKLEEGNFITVDYLVSNGDSANGINSFTFSGKLVYTRNGQEYTVTSGISLITPQGMATGGETIEGVESVKKFAPRIYSTQNRAVTPNDYETLIPAKIFPQTESISVFGGEELVPPQYGKVFISIKPRTGDFLSNLAKENLKMKLKKYAVAGIVPEILDLKYLYIEVDSKVYYNSNLAPSGAEVSTLVQNNAAKYAESTEMNRYGARFKYSKFLKIIDDSHESVTSNITNISMRRDLRVVLNTFAEYQIGFGNAIYPQNEEGYNIKTTSFRISTLPQEVYIGDVPDPDKRTGSLFLFTLPTVNSQSPTIVRRNVGNVDYEKGIVTINPINVLQGKDKDGQDIIEISATPVSNDVVGLQDLYLQLDNSSSNFETIVDEISSGLDPSASNYVVSASYSTGSLVRAGGPSSTGETTDVNRTSTNQTITSTVSTTGTTSGSSGYSSGSSGSSGSSSGSSY
tara:strand:- start:20021 stop:22105 length:2085 start_codon:yes stop_codon:yes gene_type:complete